MNVSRVIGKLGLAGLLLSAIWLTGCGTTKPTGEFAPITEEEQAAISASQEAAVTNNIDRISIGEAITITFADIPSVVPPVEERVKEDGTITLLHNQTFTAAGKNRRQLEEEIRSRYVPKYYVNMTVSIKQQENTRFYFVGGEVRTPGRQVYLGAMTVVKAIQSCGDFTDFANKRKVRLRHADGRVEIVNVKKAIEDPSYDRPVFPGDTITVPRSLW